MPHVRSYYAASCGLIPDRPALQGTLKADVAVVGAGFTGLSAALDLAEAGYRVVVLEGQQLGWAASGRNGGQIWTGFSRDMDEIASQVGLDQARALFRLALEAKALIHERCKNYAIDCDLRSGLFEAALKPSQHEALIAGADSLAKTYGFTDYEIEDKAGVGKHVASDSYLGGRFDPTGGHLHPLKYALGLGRACEKHGVQLFENTPVIAYEGAPKPLLKTAAGQVRADYIIFAGNALLQGLVPQIRPYQMPVGTYMIATEPMAADRAAALMPSRAAAADCNFALNYYRLSADHRMLWGGRVSYSRLAPASIADSLSAIMLRYLPQLEDLKIDYAWGGYISITPGRMPHLGSLDGRCFFAQGFSGQGVALTGIVGRSLALAVQGSAEKFDVFARVKPHAFPGLRFVRTPVLVAMMAYYRLLDWLS